MIYGRLTFAPNFMELAIGLPLILVSVWMVRIHLRRLRQPARASLQAV
jgi:hypothetical protein